jgi:hypothetical protein
VHSVSMVSADGMLAGLRPASGIVPPIVIVVASPGESLAVKYTTTTVSTAKAARAAKMVDRLSIRHATYQGISALHYRREWCAAHS